MQPIVKFMITKTGIISTLQTAVWYGPHSLGGIGIFDPIMIQGSGQIVFLIKKFCEKTPSSPLLHANLYHLQLEAGWGGIILENDLPKTQRWLQTESWIHEVWKFMSTNNIHIYHPDKYVLTQRTYDACLMTHLTLNGDSSTSEIHAINWCYMSKGVFFIRDIINHQVTHLNK